MTDQASTSKTILLVEDEALIALNEKMVLEEDGYSVVTARTGEEAVRIACDETYNIDLILKTSRETVLRASVKMAFRLHEANTNLRGSEERFRLLAENARDLIYRIDLFPERRFTFVSPSAYDLTGYTPEDHYTDPDLGMKLIYPSDKEHFQKAMDSGRAFHQPVQLRWVRKDNTVIWTEQNNVPVYDESGTMIAIEGIARDVTERKGLEHSLKKSNQRLAAFLEISRKVGTTRDTQALLQYIVDSAANVTPLRNNAIYLKHSDETIRLSATTPPLPEDFPEHLRTSSLCDHPHIKHAIDTGENVHIPDTALADLTEAEQDVVRLRDLRTIVYIPVRSYERVLGVLIISSTGEPCAVDTEEITLLRGFADQAGRVMEQIRSS